MVFVFALLMIGVGFVLGSTIANDTTPMLGRFVAQLNPSGEPVDPNDTRKQLYTVRPGSSAVRIGEELQERGLIRSALAFRMAVDRLGVGSQLAAGDYELSKAMSTEEVVYVIARGQVKRGIIATIPEGWRAEQVADRLDGLGFTGRDEFLQAVANPRTVPGVELLGEPVPPSLEGYLFPDTYEVKERVTGVQAAELMVRMFAQRALEPLRRASAESRLTPHELVVLASIVEREAQMPAERTTIASVYLNRLGTDMPLQADPTVQYAVANKDLRAAASYGYWKRDLTIPDLESDSPYNTYIRKGLPPTPICNPGLASIQAAIAPARTDYFYFVARGDGSHLFARTLDEHNANVAKAIAGQ